MLSKICLCCILFLCLEGALAEPFAKHKHNIASFEAKIKSLDAELEKNVAAKKTTRNQERIEEILQRIVEIHGELISLRKDLDGELAVIRQDHFEEGKALNMFAEVKERVSYGQRKKRADPLQIKLSALFNKIESKYASFLIEKQGSEALENVETVVQTQKGKRKSKEAEVYLRKKSEVKLEE